MSTNSNGEVGINSNEISDLPKLLVNNIAANYISKLMDQTNMNIFSVKNLIKIILVLSIDEMRKGVKDLFGLGKQYFPECIKYLIGKLFIFTIISQKIRFPTFRKQNKCENIIISNKTGSRYIFEWKNFQLYQKVIYDQLINNNKCQSIKVYNNTIETVEYGKNVYSVDYNNIKIPIDDDKFLIIDKASYKSDETFDINSSISITDDCLSYYITQDEYGKTLKSYMINVFKHWCNTSPNYVYGCKFVYDILPNKGPVELESSMSLSDLTSYLRSEKYTVEQKFTAVIMKEYPKFDHRKVYLEVQIIMNSSYMPLFSNCSKGIQKGKSWTEILTKMISQINFGKLDLYKLITTYKLEPSESSNSGNDKMELIKKDGLQFKTDSIKSNLTGSIESSNNYSDEELLKSFIAYLEKYNDNKPKNHNKDIVIYELKLSKTKKVSQTENPEYTTWKELKDEIMSKVKDSIDINKIGLEKPPIKFLESVSEDKEIIKTQVNSVYKSSDTLYLPKNVSTSIFKIMDNFMNKKDGLFKRLGIPNKLGICLYGKPGTGKSTAIKVIASYLGKDIYYLNMNGITKNSELKMMFDSVTKQSCDGGIIVFEDIDCMTDIVKPRRNNDNNDKLIDVMNNDELNLSYLLNLLDGTLCANNTIFIITTNHIDHLDPALIRSGRCDIKIEFKECDRHQIGLIWKSVMETQLDDKILNSIPEYKFTPADLLFHLIEYVYHPEINPIKIFDELNNKIK